MLSLKLETKEIVQVQLMDYTITKAQTSLINLFLK